ncbi:MAG TPA: hypothetical protein P5119_12565 [Candidatus Aminicenantes bacterium]|nr:hypothetical protein [Candidatus Aminicenantes bacterium]HRY66158.1 hypothetical protein [Candidatus Aminicenantes bacterium]HRZ73072.1 hypothetical protein [Candidatus Aminicenantes bacterium]
MRGFRGVFIPLALGAAAFIVLAGSCSSPSGPGPLGRMVARSDCKSGGAAAAGRAVAAEAGRECLEYEYDGRSVLRLKHVNAAFNCCPGEVSAAIEISDGAVRIEEKESSSLCDCNCLYDLSYEITGLAPGAVRISVVGPYQPEAGPPLEFVVDLGQAVSGTYCVERTVYPWGF